MRSILAFNDYETAWSPAFEDSTSSSPEIIISIYLTKKAGLLLKRSKYQISSKNFMEFSNFGYVESYISLSFALFEPFTETSSLGEMFGFNLSSNIFYTDNKTDLDVIINHLKSSCILTHIEEELILIKEIGRGSTSIVYLAQNWERTESFAVKCISKNSLKKTNALKNLQNEISIMRKIKFPSLAQLHRVYEDEEQVYLVMEYLPHGNMLKRVLDKEAMNEEKCARFMKNLLETLNYLHSNNIVHRDLKLENILMTDDSTMEFKIIDFGLAYNSNSFEKRKCGSPGYVAPEMLRDEEYDSKIDVFSAGVILYILLHGEHPFEAGDTSKILTKNLECKFKVNKKFSTQAAEFIRTAMDPFPEQRPSALQLLEHPWLANKPKMMSVASIVTCLSSNVPQSI